jgi:hypothetical protein
MPLPPAVAAVLSRHPLEAGHLLEALVEWRGVRAVLESGGSTKKPRHMQFKEDNVRVKLRELRRAIQDEAAMVELVPPPCPGKGEAEGEAKGKSEGKASNRPGQQGLSDRVEERPHPCPEEEGLCDRAGRIVLVMFPCDKFGCEISDQSTKAACDLSFLRPIALASLTQSRLVVKEVAIVMIDETWPRARKMFYEMVYEGFDADGGGSFAAIDECVSQLFSVEEWETIRATVLDAPKGKRFNPAFERNAFVIKMGPELPEQREQYPRITHFQRKQEEELGVCTLEAAVRLAELIGHLSSQERAAAQEALDDYLIGKPVGTTAMSGIAS